MRDRVHITTSKDEPAEWDEGDDVLVLHERTGYRIHVRDREPALRAYLGEREVSWHEQRACFEVSDKLIAFWAGESTLSFQLGEQRHDIRVRVEPDPRKAQAHEFAAMLGQLESWLAGVSVGHEGGRAGKVTRRGVPASVLIEALAAMVPEFTAAVREVIGNPRTVDRELVTEVPLRMAARVGADATRFAARDAATAAWLRAESIAGAQPLVPQHLVHARIDHPVNLYVERLVTGVLARLEQARAELERLARIRDYKTSLNDTAAWCLERARILAEHARALERVRRGSWLHGLPGRPVDAEALSVIIDQPAYARVHHLGRHLLTPLFSLERGPDDPGAAVRSSFDLYELWTMSLVQRSLAELLREPDWRWRGHLEPLYAAEERGEGARVEAEGPDGARLEILFNHRFKTVPHKKLTRAFASADPSAVLAEDFSLSTLRFPDLVVRYRRGQEVGRWVCLDAKYRLQDNIPKAMEMSVHGYRDCLWMGAYGGRCRAAALLLPACADTVWTEPGFLRHFGIGVWSCPPGMGVYRELAEWLIAELGIPA